MNVVAKRVRRALGARVDVRDEAGQIIVISGLAMVMLLCCVGLVVDVGHAMLVQRQLQAGVDAGALAGVQQLPDKAGAESVAMQFGPTPGSKNAVNTVNNAVTTAKAACLAGVPGCNRMDGGVNGIVVEAQSRVPTWFGRIIGINSMTVNARATACAPCSVKPLDIMIVLDRTGSMCQSSPGVNDPNCTDLKNAQEGVRTFLSLLDPSLDKVGLALFPPVLNTSLISNCGNPTGAGYKPWDNTPNPNVPTNDPQRNTNGRYYGYDQWWSPDGSSKPGAPSTTSTHYVVASLEGADGYAPDDYLVFNPNPPPGTWDLNPQSALIQRLGCAGGAGGTSYALSIEEAQYELSRNGRGNVQDVIIFLSDGAANTWPQNVPSNHWTNNWSTGKNPCLMGVTAAANAKASGTIIYTIGYDLDAGTAAPEKCRQPDQSTGHQNANNPVESSGLDAYTALHQMATSPLYFYNKPNPGQLNDIFRAIAVDLSGSRGRLIDNTAPNLIG